MRNKTARWTRALRRRLLFGQTSPKNASNFEHGMQVEIISAQKDPNAVDRPGLVPKFFLQHLSHRIFEHMHGALNIIKK